MSALSIPDLTVGSSVPSLVASSRPAASRIAMPPSTSLPDKPPGLAMTTQNNFSLIVEPADVLNMGRKSRLFIVRSALDPLRSRTVEDNKVVRAVFIYHG